MNQTKILALILAAGKGTKMKSIHTKMFEPSFSKTNLIMAN